MSKPLVGDPTGDPGSITPSISLAADLNGPGVDGVASYESEAATALPSLRPHIWRLGRPEYLT